MTVRKIKAKKAVPASKPDNSLHVAAKPEENDHKATAKALISPGFRHGQATAQLLKANLGDADFAPSLADYADAISEKAKAAASGDLTFASRMLASQAITLDGIFAEMARRMAMNMGDYLGATETYARIALKAQANSRATIEALGKLHQPREQTVRHVRVNQGAQAVIADQFHQHQHARQGGQENGAFDGQPHTTGTGAAGTSPALPRPNPLGETMPLVCGEGEPAVQDARGQG